MAGCRSVDPEPVVVDGSPETIILDGESDWAHPDDPEVYPYFIQLNDPALTHHPFASGDRIPDRTYVVFKALARNIDRLTEQGDDFAIGINGYMQGVRQNFTGGTFSFGSEASDVDLTPTWDSLCDTCWYADTLGFLTAPRSEFTITMQSVDGDGLRDGSPADASFEVGYPPCLQCIELLPWSSFQSEFDASLPCADDPAGHACLAGITELRVRLNALDPDHEFLEFVRSVYMLVDKQTFAVRLSDNEGDDTEFAVPARLYRMAILLHGRDDPREAWDSPLLRILGWRYQVDYDCDPLNQIRDGGGIDDINDQTWGEPGVGDGLAIDPETGLWRLDVDVAVPDMMLTSGPTGYLLLLNALYGEAQGSPIFAATTRQFGEGTVEAVALDQTMCGFHPARPATYNLFRKVRPSAAEPPPGKSWRDCNLFMEGIRTRLPLAAGAMASHENVPMTKRFRLVLETPEGDFTSDCGAR